MKVDYAYCQNCGTEYVNQELAYSARYANGDAVICPKCGEEIIIGDLQNEEDYS